MFPSIIKIEVPELNIHYFALKDVGSQVSGLLYLDNYLGYCITVNCFRFPNHVQESIKMQYNFEEIKEFVRSSLRKILLGW